MIPLPPLPSYACFVVDAAVLRQPLRPVQILWAAIRSRGENNLNLAIEEQPWPEHIPQGVTLRLSA